MELEIQIWNYKPEYVISKYKYGPLHTNMELQIKMWKCKCKNGLINPKMKFWRSKCEINNSKYAAIRQNIEFEIERWDSKSKYGDGRIGYGIWTPQEIAGLLTPYN